MSAATEETARPVARRSRTTTRPSQQPKGPAAPAVPQDAEALATLLGAVDADVLDAALRERIAEGVARVLAEQESGQQPRNIVEALVAVMREVKAVGKDGRNEQHGFIFRGIDGVLNALGPAMRKVGVVPTVRTIRNERSTVEVGRNRTTMAHAEVEVEYTFHFSNPDSGDMTCLSSVVPGEAMDSGDKALSKAMSVAYRTCLIQTFALPTHEPDPDAQSYERSPALDPAEVRAAIDKAIEKGGDDPAAVAEALIGVGEHYGAEALSAVQIADKNGEPAAAADLLRAAIGYYQQAAAKAAEQVKAEQDAAEQGDAPPADEPTSAPESAPSDEARAPASAPAPASESASAPAPAPSPAQDAEQRAAAKPSSADRAKEHVRTEVVFQAEHLGIDPRTHVSPLLEERNVRSIEELPPAMTGRFLADQRKHVIAKLREKGLTEVADRYEALGLAPIVVLSDVIAAV